ncbi:transglycosylase family protein [Mycobacterium attenuatum]|uniref:Resuscitation-promoting factor RpfD n=1 Tax=Mycobacterium attenuatum TaxID=2341086 RepID=A0A498Q7Z7_9MYCO|nr:transglycosylase family protein [Mycobacterium attenuatum]VBA40692.1 Resuscitation-promoting factor RpfD [Mycobacterium attenuatum]VBA56411.1 Resuscitation-promoting factor RpfD [Mycobacterium attenuatum]VBA59941.1 Resuscitation-promoting factor RpfD [Mycobacterium attenuatum]
MSFGKTVMRDGRSGGGVARRVFAAATVAGAVWVLAPALSPGSSHADSVNWEAIAQCESGGNWAADTGNGFYGGLQISRPTWEGNGGAGLPSVASPDGQIEVGERIMTTQGPGAWPRCSSCSRGDGPVGSLTHILTALMASSGGCPGNTDD